MISAFYRKRCYCISVIKSKRGESDLQFLDTAYQLYIFSVQQCVKFPKRYTFYVSQEISHTASEIQRKVKCGNSIFPSNAHEYQKRRDYFIEAYADAQSLISQINAATELFQISGNVLSRWMELIYSELSLLKGVMKRDKARYRRLLNETDESQDNTDELDK